MINVSSEAKVEGTGKEIVLAADLSVEAVMARWPATIAVFQAYRTACVGCFLARFDTIADVARNYHLDVDDFLRALQKEIDAANVAVPPEQ
jgi:hybrid cluster-associated redox disulfide protein